jgi:hypothetical protein
MLLYSLLSKVLRLVILSVIWLLRNELLIFSFFNYVLINVYLMVSLRDHLLLGLFRMLLLTSFGASFG